MKHFISLLLLLFSYSIWAQSVLLPTPVKYSAGSGSFVLGKNGRVVTDGSVGEKVVNQFREQLNPIELAQAGSGVVAFKLSQVADLSQEGYELTVTKDTAEILASSEAGLFYGKEAFLLLARANKGHIAVCHIQDNPRFEWRGFMLDESRHFFGKEKVLQYLDIMASLRLNVFHWHLTDEPGWRIEIKRYPKLTTIGAVGNWHDAKSVPTFYTQEEIKEVVAYAAERQIMVVPEFDMPGHATSACRAYPELSGGGEGRWNGFTFHPCKEETFEFISNVLDEIITLFPSPYIHIGGDEVHYGNQSWFKDPDIQRFIQEKQLVNETGLEHYFVRRVTDIVASKGKIMIGWD